MDDAVSSENGSGIQLVRFQIETRSTSTEAIINSCNGSVQSLTNCSSMNADPYDPQPNHNFSRRRSSTVRTKWEEAAIYAREGMNHEKFTHHPNSAVSNHAYLILHHPAFYITHLVLSVVLMLITLIEWPTLVYNQHEQYRTTLIAVHSAIEITILLFMSVDLSLRLLWLGIRSFISYRNRTLYISIFLLAMFVEAAVLLIRQDTHLRVLRVLRPVFFVDNHLIAGVRRLLQELFRCLRAISDIFLFLLFLIAFFAILGFCLFSNLDSDYFGSYGRSFVSLFVLLTTANHPDVMMQSYLSNSLAPLFFVCYLMLTAFIISNVLLGVVYSSFRDIEKNKFKKLYLHRREALKLAYSVLAGQDGIEFMDFILFMNEFQPNMSDLHKLCVYKALKARADIVSQACSQSCCIWNTETCNLSEGPLTQDQFYALYRTIQLKWNQVTKEKDLPKWVPTCAKETLRGIHLCVSWRWFNPLVGLVVSLNFAFYILYLTHAEISGSLSDPSEQSRHPLVLTISSIFLGFYCIELFLRIVGFGFVSYFQKPWNIFDFLIILISIAAQLLELHPSLMTYAICFRPLRLLRILRLKNRFKDILGALAVISSQILSVALLLIVIYYVFAIIGMESFHGRVFPGCCNESLFNVGSYYAGDENATTPQIYWLNNFDNILRSYVTLFELMIVNNWYVIMEGFASGSAGPAIRIYFMLFFAVTLVTTAIIIAYVVEAFTFKFALTNVKIKIMRNCKRYHGPRCTHNCVEVADAESERTKRVVVKITQQDTAQFFEEMDAVRQFTIVRKTSLTRKYSLTRFYKRQNKGIRKGEFIGVCVKSKDELNLLRYLKEIPTWISSYEKMQDGGHDAPDDEHTDSVSIRERMKEISEKLKTKLVDTLEFLLM